MNKLLSILWNVDPVAFSIFGLEIRYYGIFWALAFIAGIYFFTNFVRREKLPEKLVDSLFWYATILGILGARLGHCLFYEPEVYLAEPLRILNIREGGMASHGAAIGFLLGLTLFAWRNKMPFWWAADRIMIPVAIGGAGVRFGNLMNSEIIGRPTGGDWGFVFTQVDMLPRHPAQLYEAIAYAVFGLIGWVLYKRMPRKVGTGFFFGYCLTTIFTFRFFVEFCKEVQSDFEVGMALDMGQLLSIPFVILGVWCMVRSFSRR